MLTSAEHLEIIRRHVKRIKDNSRLPRFGESRNEQDSVKLYFMLRAIDIGEACVRVQDLILPQMIFARLLCEDFIQFFWANQSKENATEYSNGVRSEVIRTATVVAEAGRAQFRNRHTGQDQSDIVIAELTKYVIPRVSLKEIAANCGLSKIYDVVYRFGSLPVHAKTFDIAIDVGMSDERTLAAQLSAISGFLRVILDVVEGNVSAEDVLRRLGLESLGGP